MIDTSLWQGPLDVSQIPVDGIIAKLSQGVGIDDPYGRDTFRQARARPLRYCGLYHYLTAEKPSWQAAHIERLCNELGLSIHSPLPASVGFAVDFEENAITGDPAPPVGVLWELCEALSATWGHHRVAVYSDLSRLAVWQKSVYAPALERHPKWIAWPGAPWAIDGLGVTLWQNDVRWVPGVNAPVDIDEVVDQARLDAWFGIEQTPPPAPAQENDMVLVFVANEAGDPDPSRGVFGIDLTMIRYFADGVEVAELRAGSVPEITVTAERVRRLAYVRTKHGPGPTSGPLAGLW